MFAKHYLKTSYLIFHGSVLFLFGHNIFILLTFPKHGEFIFVMDVKMVVMDVMRNVSHGQ